MFNQFRDNVIAQFDKMQKKTLFRVNATDEQLWIAYLASFPEGADSLFRKRTVHDCSTCRQFVKRIGGLVNIGVDMKLTTVWDDAVENAFIDEKYRQVADNMAEFIRTCGIENVFMSRFQHIGTAYNYDIDGAHRFEHLYAKLLPAHIIPTGRTLGDVLGKAKTEIDCLARTLYDVDIDAVDTVLELIDQGSLYRGMEFREAVSRFRNLVDLYSLVASSSILSERFAHKYGYEMSALATFKNTMIGTLVMDINEGMDLDTAVARYESKAAPENYKRPTALITKGMIESARAKIDEMGYRDSLGRRHATIEDITVRDVLFIDRAPTEVKDIFGELTAGTACTSETLKKLSRVESVTIDKFLNDILPTAHRLEVFLESGMENNFVNIIAPDVEEAPSMFSWPNGFSWAYNGALADSSTIKKRVKMAGGQVEGFLRCSLSWFNSDDLDLHMKEPRDHVYFGKKISHTGGNLDVDMNAGTITQDPVENIIYPSRDRMDAGEYNLYVHQYRRRSGSKVGFEIEVEFQGEMYVMSYPHPIPSQESVRVGRFIVSSDKRVPVEFKPELPSQRSERTIWGVHTGQFHPVRLVTMSPNYWGGHKTGNEHYFFILKDAFNDQPARGFFNEFLKPELIPHRKVFEVLGSRMMVHPASNQLAGLGFSSTKRNAIYCRVFGKSDRIVKVLF